MDKVDHGKVCGPQLPSSIEPFSMVAIYLGGEPKNNGSAGLSSGVSGGLAPHLRSRSSLSESVAEKKSDGATQAPRARLIWELIMVSPSW